ncbi:MAG: hypothetical protein Q9227_001379 [Pyrenula ochraceoflavens]
MSTRGPVLSVNPSQVIPSPSSAGSPPSTPTTIGTSRQWIVPPRPKPGRKPATDTPPTKRKAQNRAAQRAFRERRAARVGELEEQLKQTEAQDEEQRKALEDEVADSKQEIDRWVAKCQMLELELDRQKRAYQALVTNLGSGSVDTVPLPGKNHAIKEVTSIEPPSTRQTEESLDEIPLGCGRCTVNTRCQCMEEALNMTTEGSADESSQLTTKRPFPSSQPHCVDKRIKTEPTDPSQLETDFTAQFASSLPPQIQDTTTLASPPTSTPVDPCGFCADGTACVCAEIAATEERQVSNQTQQLSNANTGVPPSPAITSHHRPQTPLERNALNHPSHITPPPSDGDVSSSIAAAAANSLQSLSNPCVNGPGTCAQCRSDPNSTLFCKSLAASRSRSRSTQAQSSITPQDCCGGRTSDGSCCQTRSQTRPQMLAQAHAPAQSSSRLSCADTYTVLSRHPAFERASEETGSWMPRLHASSSVSATSEKKQAHIQSERHPMEIETASILNVLREFDRRFK